MDIIGTSPTPAPATPAPAPVPPAPPPPEREVKRRTRRLGGACANQPDLADDEVEAIGLTLYDYYAAAALTGLLARGHDAPAAEASQLAVEMLERREWVAKGWK